MVLTQFLFTKSMALSPHMLYNNQGTREGRKSMSFVKATTNPGLWLLPPPPSSSATSREGRLSLKAHTQAPTVPVQAHFRCCALLLPGRMSKGGLHPFCCQELYSRAPQPRQWKKNANKEGPLLEGLSILMTYIRLFWGQRGFIWFQDVSLVATHLVLNQSREEAHSLPTECLLRRGSSGVVDGLESRAKLPGFKSLLWHLLDIFFIKCIFFKIYYLF